MLIICSAVVIMLFPNANTSYRPNRSKYWYLAGSLKTKYNLKKSSEHAIITSKNYCKRSEINQK